ncbi:hypothetical protein Ancab_020757 [Ancistrocladus abbreviatus]
MGLARLLRFFCIIRISSSISDDDNDGGHDDRDRDRDHNGDDDRDHDHNGDDDRDHDHNGDDDDDDIHYHDHGLEPNYKSLEEAINDKKIQHITGNCVECLICLESFDVCNFGESRILPLCGHRFHFACIDGWLKKKPTCPVCRTRVQFKPPFSQPLAPPCSQPSPPPLAVQV